MLRPCLVAGLAAALMASACAGEGEAITGTGGNSSSAGTSGTGSGGSGATGSGATAGTGSGTAGDTGTAGTGSGATAGTGTAGTGGGPLVMPPKQAITAAMPCTTTGTPGPRKLWRLTGPQFMSSIRAIFNDTTGAAPVATVFQDPINLGFAIDAQALLVQELNASQLQDNAEAIAAWAASANKLSIFASCTTKDTTCGTTFI